MAGEDIIIPIALGITAGSIIAYARFLWRCAQPIKHGSEDFADRAWGDVVAFPHIADRHLDFGGLKAPAQTSGEGRDCGAGAFGTQGIRNKQIQVQSSNALINEPANRAGRMIK